MYILIGFAVLVCFLYGRHLRKQFIRRRSAVPADLRALLQNNVAYYRQLSGSEQLRFEKDCTEFLQQVRVEGVGTAVEDLDKALVAASAIIPIFGFKDWKYFNLTNVILYPDTFNERYQFEGQERNVLGMVGSGAMNGQMLLSRNALRAGFLQEGHGNTAIHEFVHLLDKSDGAVDGVPENLLEHAYSVPWLQLIHREIQRIEAGHSDINPYAATNPAEFFAVASEYFFQRPHLLESHHPELYAMLVRIFHQQPGKN
ncbi:MAG TPA: M90 family metallopeptidase [Chitinophaga sp.]